jgi:hypothetical protein
MNDDDRNSEASFKLRGSELDATTCHDFKGCCNCDNSESPFKEVLDEQLRQISELKLKNAQAREKIKTEMEANNKLREKISKLDKYYQKQKNKKYRNCGS